VTPFSFVVGYQRFRGPYRLHLQGGPLKLLVSCHNTTPHNNPEDLDLKHHRHGRLETDNKHFQIKVVVPNGDSPPSSAEVKNAWSYTSIPTISLHGVVFNQTMDIYSCRGTYLSKGTNLPSPWFLLASKFCHAIAMSPFKTTDNVPLERNLQ
jgi:hypothetical protein